MRENNLLVAAAVAEIPMSVRSSPMPPTSCGARTAFGCSRWTTAGAGYSPPRALERRVRRLACVQARRPLRRPSADLHGACEAVCLDLRRCGAGAGLADGSRLPVSVGPLHQPDQVLGHPAVLRLRRTAPDQRRRREVQSHAKEQIIHGRIYRNIAELRNAVRGFVEQYNAQWIVEKNGYLAQARRRGTPRSGPPHETNLCPRNRVRYTSISAER